MDRKSYTPEQLINKLREVEILLSQGIALAIVWKKLGLVTTPTTVGVENTRLKKLVADLPLDNAILKERRTDLLP